MLTYTEATIRLGLKTSKKLENNTYLERLAPDSVGVRLHDTVVVEIRKDGRYILKTGGWQTVTTKDRINGYSPVKVYQQKGKWFTKDGKPFVEGMTVVG